MAHEVQNSTSLKICKFLPILISVVRLILFRVVETNQNPSRAFMFEWAVTCQLSTLTLAKDRFSV